MKFFLLLGNQTVAGPHRLPKYIIYIIYIHTDTQIMEVNGSRNCMVTCIRPNIFFCEKKIHTGLEQLHFGVKYPFKGAPSRFVFMFSSLSCIPIIPIISFRLYTEAKAVYAYFVSFLFFSFFSQLRDVNTAAPFALRRIKQHIQTRLDWKSLFGWCIHFYP